MSASAHVDGFARDRAPRREAWPDFVYALPQLRFPERLNCAVELLDRAVDERGWGERPALSSPTASLSYVELRERVDRIARVLVEDMGAVPGNRVLLRGCNTPTLAAIWLAVQKAGCIAVTSMPLLRARELAEIIDKAQVSHAFCETALLGELEAARARCPSLRALLTFADDAGENSALAARCAAKPAGFDAVDTAADDIALIAFTSGTTGVPKGAMHSHRDVMSVCACFPRSILEAGSDDVFCGPAPLAFTFGLGALLLFPLALGASALLLPQPSPALLLEAIARHRTTTLFATPTFYRQMLPLLAGRDVSSLRRCVAAGEPLPAATWRQWQEATGIRLIDGIGSTELLHIFISARAGEMRPGATGKPVPGYAAAVLDAAGRPVAPGVVGRLAVKGPTGCRYLDDPRQQAYVQGGWNITGDAYWIDADGYFHFAARTDDLIIAAGCNIGAPEIEDVLLSHPAVAECAVVGVPDAERGQALKACIVLRPGLEAGDALAAELQEHVRKQLAPFKAPRIVEFRDALPRTETGKLQRFRLREEAAG
ncbi:benzoate-CoA ligase family protein [Sulfurisoma sediminicola]|uniref:Anthranilate--CoA ligase n=1 Tax=Sulfurisoma sediminicola TaxID=1381557 RepID=A0A497XMR6_9PROT|nr:benzoate-CoA ligase family protein [Sulfurisoma sediminicola]RLJ67569.1 anthranilate--CoA ligase [Sulfurisoma sediminicola]